MNAHRIFVKKKKQFDVESHQLQTEIKQNLHINSDFVQVINLYDVFGISKNDLERAKYTVFAEPVVNEVVEQLEITHNKWFVVEPLPGQYDQRSDSAKQALNLLGITSDDLIVTTGRVIILDEMLSDTQVEQIKSYYINPLESQIKDLNILEYQVQIPSIAKIPVYTGFTNYSADELIQFRQSHGLAMSNADLVCIQNYFRDTEKRDPNETEIKVLDTYWSDHCRHTTFETYLTNIKFADGKFSQVLNDVFNHYQNTRENYYGDRLKDKPITLMDLATICAKDMRKKGKLDDVEISDEINACSLVIEIKVNNKPQKWSLQFKNETHNHPTEIEPYGGASTCVGGAIRDPLSGRSYVYQAMRISGAANPLEDIKDTISGKLPQKIITTKAAHGFSSYGNQIGLATTYVREIYHAGYKAKRMEVGVVVAAAPFENIRREKPVAGDVIILVGGKTGRDGCGGATGSSKEHDDTSATLCGAEVQKGNPVVERKIQRLFRNPKLSRLIKKCNDFGAGGVSVAIGELADGVEIYLDKVPTKYTGLTGTELAISESQERMAVVVALADVDTFIKLADEENLDATEVAIVTDKRRMTMYWNEDVIVYLSRDFLDTNGAKANNDVLVTNVDCDKFPKANVSGVSIKDRFISVLSSLNGASQQGLIDRFDATIGASTVLMPFGGKYQLTPSQVSAQLIPVTDGVCDTASIASFGFDADISSFSPFHGAYYAVIDSIAKIVASGGSYAKIRFSFQEYFEKLGTNPEKWGKPFAALLGAYHVLQEFELAAIGGKDSMSGSFNDIHVPPTLISFAVAYEKANKIISPEFKSVNEYIYYFNPTVDENKLLNLAQIKEIYQFITQNIHNGNISSSYAVGKYGIAEALYLMAIGNKIGAKVTLQNNDLFESNYGAIAFTSKEELSIANCQLIGKTTELPSLQINDELINLDELTKVYQATFEPVFPLTQAATKQDVELTSSHYASYICKDKVANPQVIIPVFPGTNCEYDTAKAFNQAGASSVVLPFKNLTTDHINQSIDELARQINNSQILMLPGGFSAGDEPDGSAKFITAILRNSKIKDAVHELLERDGLILGICNGFQALVKSGLLPYGEIRDLDDSAPTLTHNLIGRHISRVVPTKIVSNMSPWLNSFDIGEIHNIAMSHGEGRFVISNELASKLAKNGQIACQYADLSGNATMDSYFNPNGSDFAIEAISSIDGRILGKMGHSERSGDNLYKNIPDISNQDIFANGVNYFK
jgi:phosphoribosylformylglycinamidine synthase